MKIKIFQASLFYLMIFTKLILLLYILFVWDSGGMKPWEMFITVLIAVPSLIWYLRLRLGTRMKELLRLVKLDEPSVFPLEIFWGLSIFPVYLFLTLGLIYWKARGIIDYHLMLGLLAIVEIAFGILCGQIIFSGVKAPEKMHLGEEELNRLEALALHDLEEALLKLKDYLGSGPQWKKLRNDTLQHLGVLRQIQKERDDAVISPEDYRAALASRSQAFRNLLNRVKEAQKLNA
ncbi:MAG: hypothetical protein HC880_09515 [Bacteroidia bacterium]|nr:hypothetical protein [Bacteroidia bacterium]